MKALLFKEYYVNQSTYIVTFILFVILALVLLENQQIPPQILIFLLGSYLWSTSYVDDQNKSHTLLNSLPIDRRMMITSKYVSGVLFGMVLLLLTIGANAFIPAYNALNGLNIAIGAAGVMILVAFYYPVYILIGARFMGYVLVAAVLGVLAISSTILQSNIFHPIIDFIQQQSATALIIGMIAISMVVLILSWLLSVRAYAAKQF